MSIFLFLLLVAVVAFDIRYRGPVDWDKVRFDFTFKLWGN